ncbi:hypothetical protein BDV95DRAFT_649359 [Massariosphaeria phaeospora]|uniref:Uncharacterized protein n=1 Tax=Massariosphaeria phaeospora TaxID=100035 RepID=A0A7C8M0T2_9PLEO|nr:hypothetical protein BDV95DRAFT_649359 [Massariosphaeria phaeospora]
MCTFFLLTYLCGHTATSHRCPRNNYSDIRPTRTTTITTVAVATDVPTAPDTAAPGRQDTMQRDVQYEDTGGGFGYGYGHEQGFQYGGAMYAPASNTNTRGSATYESIGGNGGRNDTYANQAMRSTGGNANNYTTPYPPQFTPLNNNYATPPQFTPLNALPLPTLPSFPPPPSPHPPSPPARFHTQPPRSTTRPASTARWRWALCRGGRRAWRIGRRWGGWREG